MGFTFEYIDLVSCPPGTGTGCGRWVGADEQQWNLLGRIVAGRVALGASILLPTSAGVPFRGPVVRFAESFDRWEELAFFNALTPQVQGVEFWLCVGGLPGEYGIVPSGVARSEEVESSAAPDPAEVQDAHGSSSDLPLVQ